MSDIEGMWEPRWRKGNVHFCCMIIWHGEVSCCFLTLYSICMRKHVTGHACESSEEKVWVHLGMSVKMTDYLGEVMLCTLCW